ncbi:cupin domain-containing protein [Spirosoma fluviale]|uniref:Cysteine dioxygenase n=1 Tax=Spirosoma fluviale TaxID=1597977 RepID=A0A286G4D0_9BACT|nr:hypothetical protein [Spirosoma fluviale]SOD90410.1 hypothetical protein SAMN06269250_3411 [Spirosoma fluviale]
MSSYNAQYKIPREKVFKVQETSEQGDVAEPTPLLIEGQGTYIFKASQRFSDCVGEPVLPIQPLRIAFRTSDLSTNQETDPDSNGELFYLDIDSETTRLNVEGAIVESNTFGIVQSDYAFYWISLDVRNVDKENNYVSIRFGRGEARFETQVFCYQKNMPKTKGFWHISQVLVSHSVQPMRLLRDPVVGEVPLVVKNTDTLTMEDVAANRVMPKAALSTEGQKLYDIVAGQNFVLDTPDFPAFSDAIKHSIETETGWCYKTLKDKSGEFGSDSKAVYLRITLGNAGGESPGIPFVMEIWPPQCHSPIHQHAGANAIIRVLSGEINVLLFPFLANETVTPNSTDRSVNVVPFAKASFVKDEVTWISPLLNQTHKLQNNAAIGGKPCITIQCYMYDEADSGHYPFFDFVYDDGTIDQFIPNSDMNFIQFKETMKKEWDESGKMV